MSMWGYGFSNYNTVPSWACHDMYNQSNYALLNPNSIMNWNPMFSYPVMNEMPNPQNLAMGRQQAMDLGANAASFSLTKIAYKWANTELGYLKQKTEELSKDESITAEQKAEVQKILDAVQEKIDRLNELKEQVIDGSADPNEAKAEMHAIRESAQELKKQAADYAKAIADSIDGTAQNQDGTQTPAAVTADGSQHPVDGADGAQPPAGQLGTQSAAQAAADAKTSKIQGKNIANDIFLAIDGYGTDNDGLAAAVKSIDKNNVIEVLNYWDNNLLSESGDNSMLESIYGDVFSGDTRKEYTLQIANSLKEKAEGLNLQGFDDDVFAIKRMLNKCWRPDSEIYAKINEMQAKINKVLTAKPAAAETVQPAQAANKAATTAVADSTAVQK